MRSPRLPDVRQSLFLIETGGVAAECIRRETPFLANRCKRLFRFLQVARRTQPRDLGFLPQLLCVGKERSRVPSKVSSQDMLSVSCVFPGVLGQSLYSTARLLGELKRPNTTAPSV